MASYNVALLVLLTVHVVAGDLHSAINSDDLEGVKDAIEAGEDINKKNSGKQTALMHAVLDGKADIVEYLLTQKPDMTLTDGKDKNEGYTPLHGAAYKGHAKIVKMLIDAGEKPAKRHADGFTPFHRACWGSTVSHAATVKVFLEAGCKASYESADGDNAYSMASQAKNKGAMKLIKKALDKEGLTDKLDFFLRKGAAVKEANDPKRMQEMMQNPDFMNVMQNLAGKFGGDTGKFEDALKGMAETMKGKIDPKDTGAMMDMLKNIAGGAGGATHTEL